MSENSQTPQGGKMLSLTEVIEMVKLSRTTIWRLEAKNQFPERIQIQGTRMVRWYLHEIQHWQEAQPRGNKVVICKKGVK